ncbi:unnamed protein product [Cladocopium goreaui]|uniref:Pentatricopeptide repeat-containing protein, mitochondrial n=1 Tax=Cladocopium goreaui TaxID=2562237 RepID=A0A9P1GEJ9_9DINO|nr:unnamed protein product [Cladocopium goreaui]|mmetsp:Transcript_56780/g.115789  ORF Transcript_56780/g.115789 Transcript_56780/m.115789 type:complete len:390 (-) Transcript_56780:8-1177(-)
MAPEADGKRSEETWRPIFDRLQERFPDVGANKIATILLENNGHAGQAAAALRDLCGTGKREVDPDDQEHVKTLLTSPVMFAALCKENFRKFDVNGDGVLSWTEVLPLVNTLYESFGLQPPREGNLRSFFDATDLNKDGVLSEREFKKFFECFLRYAFFDVVQAKGKSESLRELETSPNKRSRPSRDETSDDQRRVSPQKDRGYEPNRHEKGARTSAGSPQGRSRPFKVIAPHGISWRRSPELADRLEQNVPYGEVVQVLEHWVKTDHGWLPVHDTRGKLLIQPVPEDAERGPPGRTGHPAGAAMSACRHDRREKRPKEVDTSGWVNPSEGAKLRSDEEDWKDRFERLQERFPMLSAGQVLQKLRAHQGHAGHTAAALRELAGRHGGPTP